MIEREDSAVPAEPTNLGKYERVCPVHNVTFHAHLVNCPECLDNPPTPNPEP